MIPWPKFDNHFHYIIIDYLVNKKLLNHNKKS